MSLKTMSEMELEKLGHQVTGEKLRRSDRALFHRVAKGYQMSLIHAVKLLREATNKSLRECKYIVEYWAELDSWYHVPTGTFTPIENKSAQW